MPSSVAISHAHAMCSLTESCCVWKASHERAPESFEQRIDFWHRECGMGSRLRGDLHTLRKWANAARHHDQERWQREGPRCAEEASQRVAAIEAAIGALEQRK